MEQLDNLGQTVGGTVSGTFDGVAAWLFGGFSLGRLIAAVVVLLVCLLAARLILAAVRRGTARSHLDTTLQGFLLRLLKVFLVALSVMIAASTLGVDVTSLVAVLGVASLAISLALQGTLSNLVGGVLLLTAKPFTLGDLIQCGDMVGVVKSIGLFYTNIMTYDNKHIHMPNSTVADSTIINYTSEPKRMVEIKVNVDHGSSINEVKDVLREAAQTAPGLLPEEPVRTVISGYTDSGVTYMLRLWVNSADYFDALFVVNERVKVLFEKYGIRMSYPHMNVHLDR